MANGFLQRFQGKIKVGLLYLGSSTTGGQGTGGIYDLASGTRVGLGGALRLSLPVTAVANTDYPALIVPPGAAIESIVVYTTTAYTGTGVTVQIGSSAGDTSYVAATSIKSAGIVTLTPAATATASAALLSAPAAGLFIRVAQSGTPTAVGAATLVVAFDLL